jgi:hypothetical protein
MKQTPSTEPVRPSSRLCRDCRFAINAGRKARCSRRIKNPAPTHPLTGFPRQITDLRPFCETERADNDFVAVIRGTCGRSGRFFRAKPIAVIPASPNPVTQPEIPNAHEIQEGTEQTSQSPGESPT